MSRLSGLFSLSDCHLVCDTAYRSLTAGIHFCLTINPVSSYTFFAMKARWVRRPQPSWRYFLRRSWDENGRRRTFFDRHAGSWDERFHDADERARLSELVDSFGLAAGDAVLDVGTGTGVLLPFLREAIGHEGRLAAMDFSFNMLQQAGERRKSAEATFLNGGVESIPFCSRQFDFVTCFAAFPHFPNKGKALLEMVRVLRPGGKLAIAHLKSAEEINRLHGQIGGAVAAIESGTPKRCAFLWRVQGSSISQL